MKKSLLIMVFISLFLHIPIYSETIAQKTSRKIKDLKSMLQCWKRKEGCSSQEILAISAIITGLLAVAIGTTYGINILIQRSRYQKPYFKGKTPFLDVAPEMKWSEFARNIDKNPTYVLPSIPPIIELATMNKIPGVTLEDKAYELLKPSMIKIAEQYGSLGADFVFKTTGRADRIGALLKAAGFDDKTTLNIQIRLNNVVITGQDILDDIDIKFSP